MPKNDKNIRTTRKTGQKKAHKEIITTHINADFDALSSMVAAKKLYPEAVLVFPGWDIMAA